MLSIIVRILLYEYNMETRTRTYVSNEFRLGITMYNLYILNNDYKLDLFNLH